MCKVVLYIGSLSRGGAERVIATLANYLNKNSILCVVVTTYQRENEYELDEGIKRIILSTPKKRTFFSRFFSNINQLLKLRNVIKKEHPNTVLSFMGEPNFRMLLSCLGVKTRKVISIRNDPNKEYPTFISKVFAKILFRLADHVVFQTEDARSWFPVSIQKKSSIILNPVDDVFFNTKFDGVRHNFVTTGRLTPQKNHKVLINAFAKIADKINDNLYIYGEGELRAELEQLVSDLNMQGRVFLPGAVKNVANIIKSAKLFVLSSDYEGLPNSLMEAMALGIPCISTDCPCGGPRMLLNDGFLIKVGDDVLLANLLLKIGNDEYFRLNYRLDTNSFRVTIVMNEWQKVIL